MAYGEAWYYRLVRECVGLDRGLAGQIGSGPSNG